MTEPASFENPLIPNAMLRGIYRAMLRVHLFERSLPGNRRSCILGREGPLVASSISLQTEDLVSDSRQGPAILFLRGAPLHRALYPEVSSTRRGIRAECGSAATLPFLATTADRLWAAVGAAQALSVQPQKVQGSRPVVITYLQSGEIAPAPLRRVLATAQEQTLPMLFVVTPSDAAPVGKATASTLALQSGVAGIAVDLDDAVAIYRVVQESLGRARAGGGPALIDCIPYLLSGSSATKRSKAGQALQTLEAYLLGRHIVTRKWIAQELREFARHLRKPVH